MSPTALLADVAHTGCAARRSSGWRRVVIAHRYRRHPSEVVRDWTPSVSVAWSSSCRTRRCYHRFVFRQSLVLDRQGTSNMTFCLTVSQWAPDDRQLDRASPAAATDGRSRPRVCLLKVPAVRARYEHLAGSWRRATPERRRGLIGELELLALQLPAVSPDDPDRDEIVGLRAAILELVTEISIGLADPN